MRGYNAARNAEEYRADIGYIPILVNGRAASGLMAAQSCQGSPPRATDTVDLADCVEEERGRLVAIGAGLSKEDKATICRTPTTYIHEDWMVKWALSVQLRDDLTNHRYFGLLFLVTS